MITNAPSPMDKHIANKGTIVHEYKRYIMDEIIKGKEPNYELLNKLSKEGVKAMVVDALYSGDERKTAAGLESHDEKFQTGEREKSEPLGRRKNGFRPFPSRSG